MDKFAMAYEYSKSLLDSMIGDELETKDIKRLIDTSYELSEAFFTKFNAHPEVIKAKLEAEAKEAAALKAQQAVKAPAVPAVPAVPVPLPENP